MLMDYLGSEAITCNFLIIVVVLDNSDRRLDCLQVLIPVAILEGVE